MTRATLPRKYILKKNGEINSVINQGKIYHSSHFTLFALKSGDLKVAFAVEKGYKSKPGRNKLKRWTRELWRLHFRTFSFSARIVIIIKKNAGEIKFNLLEQDFVKLVNRIQHDIDNESPKTKKNT